MMTSTDRARLIQHITEAEDAVVFWTKADGDSGCSMSTSAHQAQSVLLEVSQGAGCIGVEDFILDLLAAEDEGHRRARLAEAKGDA